MASSQKRKSEYHQVKMLKNFNNVDINIFLIEALEGDQLEERPAAFDVSSCKYS